MPAKRSMIQVYLISMIVLATVPAVSLLSLWMSDQYQRHELRVSKWTESHLQSRRELLQQEVRRTVRYIEFKRAQLLQRLRREMKDRVIRNYRLVEAVYQQGTVQLLLWISTYQACTDERMGVNIGYPHYLAITALKLHLLARLKVIQGATFGIHLIAKHPQMTCEQAPFFVFT